MVPSPKNNFNDDYYQELFEDDDKESDHPFIFKPKRLGGRLMDEVEQSNPLQPDPYIVGLIANGAVEAKPIPYES